MHDGVERDDRCQHAREILVYVFEGHRHYERWAIIRCERKWIAPKLDDLQLLRLQASGKGALQGSRDEGVLFGAEVSLRRAGAFARLSDGRQIDERGAIAVDEIFEQ